VISTKRTILSPFTKEYRVRVTISGIRLFLEGFSKREPCNIVQFFICCSYAHGSGGKKILVKSN